MLYRNTQSWYAKSTLIHYGSPFILHRDWQSYLVLLSHNGIHSPWALGIVVLQCSQTVHLSQHTDPRIGRTLTSLRRMANHTFSVKALLSSNGTPMWTLSIAMGKIWWSKNKSRINRSFLIRIWISWHCWRFNTKVWHSCLCNIEIISKEIDLFILAGLDWCSSVAFVCIDCSNQSTVKHC